VLGENQFATSELFLVDPGFFRFFAPFEVGVGQFFHPVRSLEVVTFQFGSALTFILGFAFFIAGADSVLDPAGVLGSFELLEALAASPALSQILIIVAVEDHVEPFADLIAKEASYQHCAETVDQGVLRDHERNLVLALSEHFKRILLTISQPAHLCLQSLLIRVV